MIRKNDNKSQALREKFLAAQKEFEQKIELADKVDRSLRQHRQVVYERKQIEKTRTPYILRFKSLLEFVIDTDKFGYKFDNDLAFETLWDQLEEYLQALYGIIEFVQIFDIKDCSCRVSQVKTRFLEISLSLKCHELNKEKMSQFKESFELVRAYFTAGIFDLDPRMNEHGDFCIDLKCILIKNSGYVNMVEYNRSGLLELR